MDLFNRRKWQGLIVILLLLTIGIGAYAVKAASDLESKLDVFLQVLDIVKGDYVEKRLDNQDLIYGAIRGMLSALDDPYTRFMEPSSYKEMKIRMSGSYSGVGIYIGIKDENLMVIAPIEGTPAYNAGLKSGDQIKSIDGKGTEHMALEEAVSLIRGKKGSIVRLGILRKGAKKEKEYAMERDNIVIKSVEKKILSDNIGYIKLITFEQQKAPQELRSAIDYVKEQNAKGLILDVRNNGGGLLQNAVDIGSMFISEGAIVFTVDRNQNREAINSTGNVIWEKPLVLLVNGASASASEILAGAIRDRHVGKVVGTTTFGKASVQNIRQLEDGSALLVTVAKYLTPDGHDIHKKGITPDVVVEIPTPEAKAETEEQEMEIPKEMEEKDDIQLQKAIEIIKQEIGG
jgi:carboxyl-terminal processing protease